MQYARLGRTELEVSRLGFGAMRLPSDERGRIIEDEAVRIIHRAFELGVNYIDTAVMYCNFDSQRVVGQALKGWREKVVVSTKNHYRGTDKKTWRRNLEDSLRLLDIDCIDIYNFHGVNWKEWEEFVAGPDKILSWMQEAKDEGVIRHICASFHDTCENLLKIAETDAFSVITLQYNLLDRSLEPAFEELAKRDIGVVVMGPVGGGRLGHESEQMAGILGGAASTPEVALRFVLDNPHVSTAISGMSTLEQVEENCAVASREAALSTGEREQIDATLERYKGLAELYCTGCNYCEPCPSGVDIAANFLAVNQARVYGLDEAAQQRYDQLVGKAVYCNACGKCEPKCPQNIPIRVQLREAAQRFDPAYGQMALALQPIRRDNGRVEMRARLHNLSDAPAKAEVRLHRGNGISADPPELRVAVDEPFKRRNQGFELLNVPVEPCAVAVETEVGDLRGTRQETRTFALGQCWQAGGLSALAALSRRVAPLEVNGNGGAHDGCGYSFKAWPGYTEDSFLLYAELQPSAPLATQKWHVDLLLDLRNREDDLAIGFHDDMLLLRTTMPTADDAVNVVKGRDQAQQTEVRTEQDGELIKLFIETPWGVLAQLEDMEDRGFEEGEAFGFDLVVTCLNDQDWPVHVASWSGNELVQSDARAGVLFFQE